MLNSLFRPAETRSVTFQKLWATGQDYLGPATASGTIVTQDTATRVNAVFGAVNLIADSVAMLPRGCYTSVNGDRVPAPRPIWVNRPDVDGRTWQTFIQQWLASKLLSHAACVRIVRDTTGAVLGLAVLDPKRVEPRRDPVERGGRIYYDVDGQYRVESEDMIYDAELMRPGAIKGTSRVDELRETFGLASALEAFASTFFGSGSTMSGIVEVPGDVTKEQAESIQDGVEAKHRGYRKAHRPGILSGGAKWVKTSVDPDEAQMLGSREMSVEDVCRAFKIPLAMLQSSKPGSQAYASREQDAIQFTQLTLMPYITAIESHLSRLLPPGTYLRINVDGMLRAILTERFSAYSVGSQAGFLSINDIRRLEDMPAVDGGDVYRVPLANVNLDAADLTEQQMKVAQAVQLVNVGFDPEAALAAVGLPSISHTGLPSVQLQADPALAGA
jgi:HK97 family phage portal protein